MSDHRAQVDRMLAEYREDKARLAAARSAVAAVAESASSSDGLITASVGPHGQLTELRIADNAYQRHRPAELAALVVRTTAEATAKAAASVREIVEPVVPLPPAARPNADTFRPRRAVTAREELEESLEEHSWMDDASRGRS